jgi:hypothetical protein
MWLRNFALASLNMHLTVWYVKFANLVKNGEILPKKKEVVMVETEAEQTVVFDTIWRFVDNKMTI